MDNDGWQMGLVLGVLAVVSCAIVWATCRCIRKEKPYPCKKRIDGKVVVVTGADSPAGIRLVRELCKRGAERVIMAVTDVELGQDISVEVRGEINGDVAVEYCDMASIKSVRKFCTKVLEHESKIHILINHASVMWHPYRQTAEGHEYHWGVNYLSHFVMTQLLMPLLLRGGSSCANEPARVINLSSFKHKEGRIRWDDPDFRSPTPTTNTTSQGGEVDSGDPEAGPMTGGHWSRRLRLRQPSQAAGSGRGWGRSEYRADQAFNQSKLANVLFTRELARKMDGTGVNSYSVDPGVVRTGLGWHALSGLDLIRLIGAGCCWMPFLKSNPNSIQTVLYCACEPELSDQSGLYYADCRQALTSESGANLEDSYRLWEMTERTVGLTS